MIFGGSRAAVSAAGVLIVAAPLAAQPPRVVMAQEPAPVVAAPKPQVVVLPKAARPVMVPHEVIALEAPAVPMELSGTLQEPVAVVLEGVRLASPIGVRPATPLAYAQTRTVTKPPSGRPAQAPMPKPRGNVTRTAHQGFSVVLVLADITGAPLDAGDDVPPAARRALADMKDFLPYKSYKLLDAAWLLGQGTQTIRLRGVEGQEYELRLTTPTYANRESSGRVSVHFSLRDGRVQDQAVEAALLAQTLESRSEHAQRVEELQRLTQQLRAAREKNDTAGAREVEKRLSTLRASMARTESNLRRVSSSTRPIIDTNFSMEVGETVVVGTSRLKANSGALIALLTAVPPRSSSTPREAGR